LRPNRKGSWRQALAGFSSCYTQVAWNAATQTGTRLRFWLGRSRAT